MCRATVTMKKAILIYRGTCRMLQYMYVCPNGTKSTPHPPPPNIYAHTCIMHTSTFTHTHTHTHTQLMVSPMVSTRIYSNQMEELLQLCQAYAVGGSMGLEEFIPISRALLLMIYQNAYPGVVCFTVCCCCCCSFMTFLCCSGYYSKFMLCMWIQASWYVCAF